MAGYVHALPVNAEWMAAYRIPGQGRPACAKATADLTSRPEVAEK